MTFRAWLESICTLHHHREAPMPSIPPDTRDDLADLAGEAVATQIRHGLTEEQAIDLVADVLDALIVLPEPLDTGSDVAIMAGLRAVAQVLRRDPVAMEARAVELMAEAGRAKGKRRRRLLRQAGRLRKRAEVVRTRQEN